MEFINYFPSNLKYLRTRYNKTLKDVARACNKSHVAIMYWENKQREPTAIDVYNIATFFHVGVDEIIKKDLSKEKQIEEITSDEFMKEVVPMINNISNLSEREKKRLREEIEYICEDDE